MFELEVIGGGRMAEALVRGWLDAGAVAAEGLAVVELDPARRDELAAAFPGVTVVESPRSAGAVVVATKPHHVVEALAQVAGLGVSRVLSVAAGVTTGVLDEAVGHGVAVVRAMPNTPALVGAGAAAICAGRHAGDDDLTWAEGLLGAVGTVVRVDERDMDAVTAVSGSGPAYVFLLAEAMRDAGVARGLRPEVADALVRQTLLGAARLLTDGDDPPEARRAAVTSKGGTTAAAIAAFVDGGFAELVASAVDAAAERSAELGG